MNCYFCLEFHLQPLSELLIRQVGKSNVQWFSYPFLPPTTFSGFMASLVANEGTEAWRKNYIEVNDHDTREVNTLFPGVFSVGAYPDPILVRRNRHYRQHLGDVYNYEEFAWVGNKKLAVAEAFWTPELRGFLLASTADPLQQLAHHVGLLFRATRVGKKGVAKVKAAIGPYEVTLQPAQGIIPSTVAPLEMIRYFPSGLEIFHVPVRKRVGPQLVRDVYTCVFGQPVYGQIYTNASREVIIPEPLVRLTQPGADWKPWETT
ncbi:MAG: hypothetical protein K6U74_00885 [Firmicutes bacterium]|nr:hypothetical protein [Bacillota bacterium]